MLFCVMPAAVSLVCKTPSRPLPRPLAADGDGEASFTYDSVQRRLPLIVESVIDKNSYSEALQADLRSLAGEIAAGEPLKPLAAPSAEWEDALAPLLAAGDTWLSAPWFVVENYLYKRMLELTDGPTGGADPFAAQKAESLDGAAAAFADMLSAGLTEGEVSLPSLVSTALWGNLADLSLSAGAALIAPTDASAGGGGAGDASKLADAGGKMLADDTGELCAALEAAGGEEVVVVLDNCGLELVSDLLLVDGLLRCASPPRRVTLHAKARPVFVSDVVEADLAPTLAWLEEQGGGPLAGRLRDALADGRLHVESPEFYTGPLPFWEMPDELHARLAEAALVLTKGDANFRRLLGDLHWPHDTDFADLMREYWPTSLAALRTCKSGVLVGVVPAVEAAAAAAEPEKWLTGGVYGMVSFAPKATPS